MIGLDNYHLRLLKYLYYIQLDGIKLDNKTIQEIERSVQQGYVLSLTLFNLYSEKIGSKYRRRNYKQHKIC